AKSTEAEVVLCHVVNGSGSNEAPAAPDGGGVATAVRSNTRLDELRAKLVADGVTNVRTLVLEGQPAEAIGDAAQDLECDVIVMVTAGRKGISRFFAGSVADGVVSTVEGIGILLLRAKS